MTEHAEAQIILDSMTGDVRAELATWAAADTYARAIVRAEGYGADSIGPLTAAKALSNGLSAEAVSAHWRLAIAVQVDAMLYRLRLAGELGLGAGQLEYIEDIFPASWVGWQYLSGPDRDDINAYITTADPHEAANAST